VISYICGIAARNLVNLHAVAKGYGSHSVLEEITLGVNDGDRIGVVGENGAGKSTLVKVLAGAVNADSGTIEIEGKPVHIATPKQAEDLGIAVIYQEFNLVPMLSVAENVLLGREPTKGIAVDRPAMRAQTNAALARLGVELPVDAEIRSLSVAQQQMVEIAKALSYSAQVLIMDEPTATLTDTEIDELFRIIRAVKANGVGVVHISHRLEELKLISDRVTVMRDGQFIATVDTKDASIDRIISMMVGRTIYEGVAEIPETANPEVVLDVQGLNRGRMVRDVSFNLRRGEILGIAGLVGAGRTEVARAVFGADRPESGTILIHGKVARIHSPADAVHLGIGYLSEDGKRYGLATGMDVETNIVLATLRRFADAIGVVDFRKTRATAEQRVHRLAIKTPSIRQKVRNLSGGNQQKVVIAKWLTADTEILIFDEPTRGIDVGAKSEIYHLLNDLARQGKSIIMISSELPEILRMSHRIVVMCEGRIRGELTGAEATQEKIMTFATMRTTAIGPQAAA